MASSKRLENSTALTVPYLASLRLRSLRLRFGLGAKLLLIVTLVSFVGVLTSSLLLENWHRNQLIENAELATDQLSVPIQASLRHAMLTHDEPLINAIVQSLADEPGVQRIRIVDANGRVRTSSTPSEIGERIETTNPECQACHIDGNPGKTIAKKSALIETANSQFLVNVSTVPNKPECSGCHEPSIKTLGLVIIETPIKGLAAQILESSQHIGAAALITFLLLVGLMVPILRQQIANPVAELSRGVSEISAENLDYRVHVSSQDEIGDLAAGLETMRQQLKTSRGEMERRNSELAVLYKVAFITGQLLDIDKILGEVLDTVIEKLSLATGLLYLWDKDKNRFERRISRGYSNAKLEEIEKKRQEPEGDLTHTVAQSGDPFFVPDRSADPYFQKFWGTPRSGSYVNIPLKSKGKVIGTLELTSQPGLALTQRQVEILKAVGNQIGIAIDNNSLLDETRRSARESTTLYELGARISSSLDLDLVLQAVAVGARQALEADVAVVGLIDEDRGELCVEATEGTYSPDWRGTCLPFEKDRETQGFAFDRILNLENIPDDLPLDLANLLNTERAKSLLAVPLWRGERWVGLVAVVTRNPHRFAKAEIRLLARLGQQVIIAIENARLYQQVRYLAVLEERDRLACEMHDNLAQELAFLDLKTTITRDLLERGEIAQAEASLLELKHVTREAYIDTREAIFSLRTMASPGNNFAGTLREYLAEYHTHYGLEAHVIIEDNSLTQFRSEVGVQIHRIIQEALTNVRKHAQSTHTCIHFEREGELVRITVEDDGRGFDPAELNAGDGRQRFGTRIMRERAEGIGGTLEFISQVNEGTRVVLRVPTTAIQ